VTRRTAADDIQIDAVAGAGAGFHDHWHRDGRTLHGLRRRGSMQQEQSSKNEGGKDSQKNGMRVEK
jgi:hypothetical protein